MKIGFYGGVANNMYVMASGFARQGVDVLFIRDTTAFFPFSQPIWEDVAFTLPYELSDSSQWSLLKWHDKERELSWESPNWVVEPTPHGGVNGVGGFTWLETVFFNLLFKDCIEYCHAVIAEMRKCNALVVCGVEPTILAAASGVPFVIWPHGSDIRLAANLTKPTNQSLKSVIAHNLRKRLLKKAYKHCLWIGSHDPLGVGGDVGNIHYSIEHFPIPQPSRDKPDGDRKSKILNEVFELIGLEAPDADKYVFVPSRIDFRWKGTDRFLKAISNIDQSKRWVFIFSGWGEDYEQAKELVTKQNVVFLPCSLSKPLLYKLFSVVDLVVDQFKFGTYGTSAVEAMSFGTPVMMYIDEYAFEKKGWLNPPVVNVKESSEIEQALLKILNDVDEYSKLERRVCSWFSTVHDEKLLVRRICSEIESRICKVK